MTTRQLCLLSGALGLGLTLFPTTSLAEGSGDSEALSPSEIVAASVAASGGAALDAVQSVRRRAEMHLEGDLFGSIDGTWEIGFVPGQKGYHEDDFGSGVTSVGWNGTVAWEDTEAGLRDLNPQEIALNRWLWELSFLHALERDSALGGLERLDDETVGETLHYVLEYTDEHGTQTRIFVDSETSLISRLSSWIELPMVGPSAVTTEYFDYRDFDGVLLPQASTQVIENLWVFAAKFTETEIDPDLPESRFERPSGS